MEKEKWDNMQDKERRTVRGIEIDRCLLSCKYEYVGDTSVRNGRASSETSKCLQDYTMS